MNPNQNTTGILQQGQTFYRNGKSEGIVNFDTATGQRLAQGQYTGFNLPQVNPNIDGSALGAGSSLNLPFKTTPTAGADVLGTIESGVAQNAFDKEMERQLAENTAKANASNSDYLDVIREQAGLGQKQIDLEEKAGIAQKTKAKDDIDAQIVAEQNSLNKKKEAIYSAPGVTREQADAQYSEISRISAGKQADYAITQYVTGNDLTRAQALINKKIELETESLKIKADYFKTILDNNEKNLTEAKKIKLEALATKADREYQQAVKEKQELADLKVQAMQDAQAMGAPSSVISQIQSANTREGVIGAARGYSSAALDVQIKRAQLAKAQGDNIPTVKTINGVDMQWNPMTSKWENIDMGGVGTDKTQQSIDQLSFLKSTAKKAYNLAYASGPSLITKTAGDVLVGDSKFRQLEALTNTLKTNILTLATDPAIKKFFGPQMSNADVLLMTSAGTTLNPGANNPQQMKDEIIRLNNLFNRMEKAVKIGQTSSGNTITAPDGTQIIITD